MAEIRGVWGIDIGLAGLKAIRLVYAEAAKQVLATAFDYVPHPKILSQPDANPDELIAQALETFLSRNPLKNDGVAISVPGQTALARFIQLPPVEASKVVEIVKYEARQQIPFALEEVIWDYQPLGSGTEESGFLLDAEVGLFAMKRDQVQQHLAPYLNRKVEVDLVQIAPLALYNFMCHDRFGYLPDKEGEDQEEHTLLLDMGADNTTLLVSNGKKIWLRNVPLGGNHFTRALTKEMKLTFAKAEHLKCNATKSPDPKAVFQALRPVFNDYVAEIQRSIGFFSSVNREAKIGKILGVGNGFKLAGLQKFLQQNLQMDVERVESFPALAGDAVLNAPLFQENLLSFAVPYGLALQGLKVTRVHTSLLPPEITTARLVRKKKPWAVATAATLLVGLALSTIGYASVWSSVSTARFGDAETKAKAFITERSSRKGAYDKEVKANKDLVAGLENLLAGTEGKREWLEVYKAINEALPRDYGADREGLDPTKKNRIRIFSITATKYDDLGEWHKNLSEYGKTHMNPAELAAAPTGKGYVFRLAGRHFHYEGEENFRKKEVLYVVDTLLRNLQQWALEERNAITGEPTRNRIPVRQLGISHPTITWSRPMGKVIWHEGGLAAAQGGNAGGGEDGELAGAPGVVRPPVGAPGFAAAPPRKKGGKAKEAKVVVEGEVGKGQPIPQTGFVIEFVWKPIPEKDRKPTDPELEKAAGANAAPGGAPAATQPGAAQPLGQPGAAPAGAPAAPTAPVAPGVGGIPAGGSPTPGAPGGTTPGAVAPVGGLPAPTNPGSAVPGTAVPGTVPPGAPGSGGTLPGATPGATPPPVGAAPAPAAPSPGTTP